MIGFGVADGLPDLRAQAESLHTGRVDFERMTSAWDQDAQETVTSWAPVHMGVPCAFDEPSIPSRSLLADEVVTARVPVVKVSATLDGIEPDDRATVAGVGVLWVTHVPTRTNQVQKRIQCRWSR